MGYAYDTYGADQLSGLNLKAHEIALRFMFGSKHDTPELEKPQQIEGLYQQLVLLFNKHIFVVG